jgi:hypothetical protein
LLEPALEFVSFNGIRAQLDCPAVGPRRAHRVTRPPQQVRLRRVQRLIASQRRIVGERLKRAETGARAVGEPDRGRPVDLDDG